MRLLKPILSLLIALSIAGCQEEGGSSNTPSIQDGAHLEIGTTFSGTISANGFHEYSFTTGSSANSYQISLTDLGSDLGWELYDTDNWVNASPITDCDNNWNSNNEICDTSVLSASTDYYLLIDEWDSVDSYFKLLINVAN